MPYTVAAENQALSGIVDSGGGTDKNNYISLHTGDPSSTGTLEVTGGTYARVQTNWGTPSGSSVSGSPVTLNVPSGTTITHWGIWSASTTGTFIYGGTLPAPETFGSNGTYSLTPTLTASDLA